MKLLFQIVVISFTVSHRHKWFGRILMAGKVGRKVSSREHSLFDSPRACNQEVCVHLITYNNLILVHTYSFSSTEYSGVLFNTAESSKRMH